MIRGELRLTFVFVKRINIVDFFLFFMVKKNLWFIINIIIYNNSDEINIKIIFIKL